MKRILAAILAFMLLAGAALAAGEGFSATDQGLDLSCGSVRYPRLSLPEDPETEKKLNDRLLESGGIPGYLTRLPQLLTGGEMTVTWSAETGDGIFSCVFSAQGAILNRRATHVWTAANLDLATGEEIPFAALFTEEAAAREKIAQILETEVAPDLSAHLQNSELLPLPETFALSRSGLRLLYPVEQLSTLSDRAGEVCLAWNEIADVLDLSEGSPAVRFGAAEALTLSGESADRMAGAMENGTFPGLPVKLGDPLKEATDAYAMLTDPDFYEGGRMFALEAGVFRNVFLLTDGLGEDWDDSRILGIRMDRGCFCGLKIGQTTRDEWQRLLGEPESSLVWDEDRAEANRAVPGICDYYRMGGHTLRLLSDTEGVLRMMTLTE